VAAILDSSVGAFVAELRPTTTANRCGSTKLKATGRKAKAKLGCYGRATRRGVDVDDNCLMRANTRFAATFTAAERSQRCLTTHDAGDVEGKVDDLVDRVVAAVPPEATTTTSSTTTSSSTTSTSTSTTSTTLVVCGDGIVEGNEQCDTNTCGPTTGCFPAGSPHECQCCTLPGEYGRLTGLNEALCCDGASAEPAGPEAYFCPTCGSSYPTCGGVCGPLAVCIGGTTVGGCFCITL
jgi:hypothetical protein